VTSPRLSHVAFLVSSVDQSAEALRSHGFPIGAAERWEGEGTREVYVGGRDHEGSLLLMEAVREGAYRRAMAKRGPGLHHIAIDVLDLENYLEGLATSGWLLHPKSLRSIEVAKTAWLARPGVPTLIEVHGRETIDERPAFITGIGFAGGGDTARLFGALGVERIFTPSDEGSVLHVGEVTLPFSSIVATIESPTAEVMAVDHAQITIPKGEELAARSFYVDFLGIPEIEKAIPLRGRGGFWLDAGNLQVHVGGEDGVDRGKTKAHVAYRVRGLRRWKKKLAERGISTLESIPLPGVDRFEFRDPFGNRVEFVEPL
jgi:catechol 2,3-dioxygenase-like lactoylglutathione lyase family enzyme